MGGRRCEREWLKESCAQTEKYAPAWSGQYASSPELAPELAGKVGSAIHSEKMATRLTVKGRGADRCGALNRVGCGGGQPRSAMVAK